MPHLDREEVVAILLDFLARGVLSEEHFGYLVEVMERVRRQGVEPPEVAPFRLEGKVRHIIR